METRLLRIGFDHLHRPHRTVPDFKQKALLRKWFLPLIYAKCLQNSAQEHAGSSADDMTGSRERAHARSWI